MSRKIGFNYDDYKVDDIAYRSYEMSKKAGVQVEYEGLPIYFFGAKKERDGVADIFISEMLFHKVCRTLLFLKSKGIKVEVGLEGNNNIGRGYWVAFSYAMRNTRFLDCVRVILCFVFETNNIIKEK